MSYRQRLQMIVEMLSLIHNNIIVRYNEYRDKRLLIGENLFIEMEKY